MDPDLIRNIARIEREQGRPQLEVPFYEEGFFVPAWAGTIVAGSFTYTTAACVVEWTRRGNRVAYNGRIVISAIGVAPTGNLTITGWPYAGVADTNMAIAGGGGFLTWQLNVAAGYTDVALQFSNGSSAGTVVRSGDNVAPAAVAGGELIVSDCRFAGEYRIA